MSLTQNRPPDAWLSGERATDLRESLRYPWHAVILAASSADTPTAADCRGGPTIRNGQWRIQLRHLLQILEHPRSLDYGALMRQLSPFKINTSRKSRHSRIAFIVNNFKPTRINTSAISLFKPPGINTSKKHRGEGGTHPRSGVSPYCGEASSTPSGPPPLAPRTFICDNRRMPQPQKPEFQIAPATPSDVIALLQLIRGLAEYEKLSHEVSATADGLHAALFGPRPVAEAVLARLGETPVGFAVFFHNFSTFVGRPGIYLEDLFVLPEHRGKGIGKALLLYVAELANERGCGRLEWAVLDWNKPAIEFYRGLGARAMDEWTLYRVTGEPLAALSRKRPQEPGKSA
jgi:GNAT superfamily N-acetyltransferase